MQFRRKPSTSKHNIQIVEYSMANTALFKKFSYRYFLSIFNNLRSYLPDFNKSFTMRKQVNKDLKFLDFHKPCFNNWIRVSMPNWHFAWPILCKCVWMHQLIVIFIFIFLDYRWVLKIKNPLVSMQTLMPCLLITNCKFV